jgi:TolB-like protein/Flp pilus assembly protein TadD
MKRCPECRRDYTDESLNFCLDDGAELLDGPSSFDGPATAVLHDTTQPNEAATRAQIHTTEQTAVFQSAAVNIPAAAKSFDKRLLLAPLGLAVIVLGGLFGYRYFNPSTSGQINSIAVLPFENTGGNADSEYLSDGLAESLIYRLSQINGLRVSPRSSVFRYKAPNQDAERVGAELGVDAVMSGRVVQRGDNLTISVDLVDVRHKKTIWGEQFERKMSDLLATQREIASAIAEKLQVKLSGEQSKGATKTYTDSNEAYQAYLKGRYYWNRRTAENLWKAIEQLKSATEKDQNFALAYAGLADCYIVLNQYAGIPTTVTLPEAKKYAERAIALDGELAEPHASLGQIYKQSWKWEEAEREYKRALELNPNYATTYHWYSLFLKDMARFDESAVMIKRAKELDPLSSVISINIAEMYQWQKDHNASIQTAQKILELDPNYADAYNILGTSSSKLGNHTEAIANLEKAAELSNRASFVLAKLGYGYGVAGKRAEAYAVAKELEAKYSQKQASGQNVASVYSGLGEKDKAFEWLERDFRNTAPLGELRWEIVLEPIRDDPRFKDLLRRMNLPE